MYVRIECCFFYGFHEIRSINNQKPYYIYKLEITDLSSAPGRKIMVLPIKRGKLICKTAKSVQVHVNFFSKTNRKHSIKPYVDKVFSSS